MADQRKQAISIRLGGSDLRNVKRVAKRLGVRDSDIVRYAIKGMLGRIAPLCDEAIVGRNLIPVLAECGDELIRYFELDSYRLEGIVNERADERSRVDRNDIALLAMSVLREQYLLMRINDDNVLDSAATGRSLREYLYDKYVRRSTENTQSDTVVPSPEARVGTQRPAA